MAASSQVKPPTLGSQGKSEQARKMEAIKEIHQLKTKIQNMEREKATHLYHKPGDFHKEFSVFQEKEEVMKTERRNEEKKINQNVTKVRNMVKKFHREIRDVKPTPEFLERLKIIMEDIEAQISQIKDHQRQIFEELIRDERVTQQEILALEKKFESWAQLGAAVVVEKAKPAPMVSSRDITKDLPPEVADFEKFAQQNGGPRGGWDEYDHGTFLKYRNRHKGKLTFIRELASGALPTKTESEIREHERWLQEYNALNEMKKEAIQRWREKKEEEKEAALAKATEIDSEEEEMQKQEQKKKMFEEERQFRRMELNKWKVDKELERAQQEERKLREQLEKAKKEDMEKQRQMEVKKQVEIHRMKRQEEEQEKLLENYYKEQFEMEERRKMTPDLARLRERDLMATKLKVQKEREKEALAREKAERLAKIKKQVEVSVKRDPSRLLKPTKGWQERQKDTSSSGGGPIVHMPHRAVPNWRQGLS